MIRAAIRGAGLANLRLALRERQDFKTSGALHGEWVSSLFAPNTGWLNSAERDKLHADYREHKTLYVVYSYGTPIGWVTPAGDVHRVAQKFSVTTSRHQSFLHLLDA